LASPSHRLWAKNPRSVSDVSDDVAVAAVAVAAVAVAAVAVAAVDMCATGSNKVG